MDNAPGSDAPDGDAPDGDAAGPGVVHSGALALDGVAHAFFTRRGGVSAGVYASLNGGVGSKDDAVAVAENRRRMAGALGVEPACLMVPYQVHSALAAVVDVPWDAQDRPRVDALVTATPGIGLGVTGADCGIVLFADASARVVAAAHAGWKGALSGVLGATVATMERLGARRSSIVAVVGPTIGRHSYEVGPEFAARFTAVDPANARFFAPAARPSHHLFDLPGYLVARLRDAALGEIHDLALDTYADEARFFSYRRSVHRSEPDYGRQIAAIALR